MVRIAWRDLAGWANLEETVTTLSALADACLEEALAKLYEWACARDGAPKEEAGGATAKFVVLGMGKLGGEELNFSSDIDLIFCYSEEGETDKRGLSNHEFFVRLGQRLNQALNEQTADGFVFRVDMRLRPNGASGPLALSFDAMEQYYQAHGRMWNVTHSSRRAWWPVIRPPGRRFCNVCGHSCFANISTIPRWKNPRAQGQHSRELLRKGIESNIKLGPGGIREVEFIARPFS